MSSNSYDMACCQNTLCQVTLMIWHAVKIHYVNIWVGAAVATPCRRVNSTAVPCCLTDSTTVPCFRDISTAVVVA